ncbi:MAG: hypothetical protein JOZ92_02985 [Candidatus Dormibacteraeota bacterium]|nr:hypothetical protein [Candidatus Dormibacteraeota bacterium]
MALAGVAVALVILPADDSVFVDANGMHIDDATLHLDGSEAGGDLYAGDGVVFVRRDGATTVSGAALFINGHAVTGRCVGTSGAEHCSFTIDGREVTANDIYDPADRRWTRVYSDGTRIVVNVPREGSPAPVVVPFGEV